MFLTDCGSPLVSSYGRDYVGHLGEDIYDINGWEKVENFSSLISKIIPGSVMVMLMDGLKLPLKGRKKISRNRTRLDLSDVKLPLSPYLAKLTCSRRMTHADPSESKWKRGKVGAKYCETQFDLWVAHLVRLVSIF